MNSRVRDIHKGEPKFRMVAKLPPISIPAIIFLGGKTAFISYDARLVLPSLTWIRSDHANYNLHATENNLVSQCTEIFYSEI